MAEANFDFDVDLTPPTPAPIVIATAESWQYPEGVEEATTEALGGIEQRRSLSEAASGKMPVALGASWAGFGDDGGSGIATYKVCFGTDDAPEAHGCSDVGMKTEAALVVELDDFEEAQRTFRATVTAVDRAGHTTSATSVGARASAVPVKTTVHDGADSAASEYLGSCGRAAGRWQPAGSVDACTPRRAGRCATRRAVVASRRRVR